VKQRGKKQTQKGVEKSRTDNCRIYGQVGGGEKKEKGRASGGGEASDLDRVEKGTVAQRHKEEEGGLVLYRSKKRRSGTSEETKPDSKTVTDLKK